MSNVILAADLNKETIANLPKESKLSGYQSANRLHTTWDLRNSEPCEESVLHKSVGDKMVLCLNDFNNTIALATITKVNKTTVALSYTRNNSGNPETLTINEAGNVRGETGRNRTETYHYSEGHFKQMLEVEAHDKDRHKRTTQARNELGQELKEISNRLRHMELEEAQKLLKLLKFLRA